MAFIAPYAQLTGTVKVYLAPYGEAEPALNTTPGGNWVEFGATTGEQSIEHQGDITMFYDNDHQGPVTATRPEENVIVGFTLANMTLEHYARALHSVSNLTDSASPVNNRKMPLKRGAVPTQYAILMRGQADSPYGLYPAHTYIPRVMSTASPTVTRAKDGRAELECQFTALEDDAQAEADRLGWSRAQTS